MKIMTHGVETREIGAAIEFHIQGDSGFDKRHPLAESASQTAHLSGHVDLAIGVVSTIAPDQMPSSEVMAELGDMNIKHARTGLLWGDPNPVQQRYVALNGVVQGRGLWGHPSESAISPVKSALAAINK